MKSSQVCDIPQSLDGANGWVEGVKLRRSIDSMTAERRNIGKVMYVLM